MPSRTHGPAKGGGLCHGTAGNGYALLKTFERTGDEVWLERARRFAVHALEQIGRTAWGYERRRQPIYEEKWSDVAIVLGVIALIKLLGGG